MEPHHSARRRVIAAAAGIVILLSGFSALMPQTQAQGSVMLQHNDILTESIYADTITLPAGAVVYFAGDIVLSAAKWIRLEGQLRALDDGAAPYDIVLDAGLDIVITGNVLTRAGLPGENASAEDTALASPGTSGGDVTLKWGPLGTFTFSEGALIRTGDGGRGGDASVTLTSTSPTTVLAAAGEGGRGGNINLLGSSAFMYGVFQLGSGGDGGNADALVTHASALDQTANATAGHGGRSGHLALPTGFSLLTLYDAGQVSGGSGGRGGNATADAELATTAVGCGASGHQPNKRDGEDGCNSANGVGYGGDGGDGDLYGEAGGTATARSASGGDGGKGAHGEVSDTSWALYTVGGNGGDGGNAGYAYAEAGDGGDGLLAGGRGGDAAAAGGNGGAPSRAGDSGRTSVRVSGWYNACKGYAPGHCWESSATSYGCGHAGRGGQDSGGPGAATAVKGEGGKHLLGEAPSGTSSEQPGVRVAEPAADGAYYTPCLHNESHVHIF